MKINQIQQITEVYGASSARKMAPKETKASAKDKLEISDTAKHFQLALKAAKDAPDIRQDKVDKIKAQIDSGTYNVSGKEVANKMMAGFFNHSI